MAEGVFAAELVAGARVRGVLSDALCLSLHAAVTFGRRLLRDLAEARKPPVPLVRRGIGLARASATSCATGWPWPALGCRPVSIPEPEQALRTLARSSR